jgi:AcrR family transcriptional regulator
VLAARQCFADYGYAGTTNRHVADRSGLTTGAIYHYFASKQELYLAAHAGVQDLIYGRFAMACRDCNGLLAEFEAMLDEAVELNREDPSLAGFLVTRRIDAQRYPELAEAFEPPQRIAFFADMLRRAVERREITEEQIDKVMDIIRVVTAGLVFAASGDLRVQARSVEALKELLRGELIPRPEPVRPSH